jgi:hypothetical protein
MFAIAASLAQIANELVKYARLSTSTEREQIDSARLLGGKLFVARLLLLLIPFPAAALISEAIGRYLFFITVVPRNIAATYFAAKEAA